MRSASYNGKVERLFRTLRQWYRLSVLPRSLRSFQRRLDRFRAWYNTARPHQSLGVLTPEEAWSGAALPEPIPFRAADPQAVATEIEPGHHGGDPRLPVFRIDVMVSRLRRKIEADPQKPAIIVTVYGFGYKFTAGPA